MMNSRRRLLPLVHLFVVAGVSWTASPARAEEVRESHPLLGSLVRITLEADDRETGQNRIRDAMAVAHRFEAQIDPSDASSDLTRLHAGAGLGPVSVSVDVYRLFSLSRIMTRSTGGTFDVTIGSLIKRRQTAPGVSRLGVDEALALVSADKIALHPPDGVELTDAGMSIDFGAIAKGYVLERMAANLRAAGVDRALLEFEGEVVLAVGPPPEQPAFRIWVARGKSMAGTIALRDRSLSTARTRRRAEESARALVVDPRSGRIVETERQATVVARDAAIADAWSTALVVDPDAVLGLLEEPRDVEALVFDEHGEHRSPRFTTSTQFHPGRKDAGTAGPEPDREPAVPDAAGNGR